mgnify:CR=1 FL=1
MTGKERLERIIQMQYDGYTIWDMSEDDLVWLVEQAERVYELERKIGRYHEALKFYADRENYEHEHYDPDTHDYTSMIDHDKGATARKALEGKE